MGGTGETFPGEVGVQGRPITQFTIDSTFQARQTKAFRWV
jgi:hypothetical protein